MARTTRTIVSGVAGDVASTANTGLSAGFTTTTGNVASIVTSPVKSPSRALRYNATATGYLNGKDYLVNSTTTTPQAAIAGWCNVASFPASGEITLMGLFDNVGSGSAARELGLGLILSSGAWRLIVRDSANTSVYFPTAGTFSAAASTWYYFALSSVQGSAGSFRAGVSNTSGTIIADSGVLTGINTGSNPFMYMQTGPHWATSSSAVVDYTMDDLAFDPAVGGTLLVPLSAPPSTDGMTVTPSRAIIDLGDPGAGIGGALSWSFSPNLGIEALADPNKFAVPQDTAAYTLTATLTEVGNGTATVTGTIPAAGGAPTTVNISAPKRPSGTVPGTTWV